jgi:hypothetical protein
MSRRVTAGLAGLVAVVLLAVPAAADDEYEIDERLSRAGFDLAYTEYLSVDTAAGEGVRVVLDYETGSDGVEAYQQESLRAAELIWEHLELRVVTVVVAPSTEVSWRDGDLPPAVAFSRSDLQEAFGPRSGELDEEGAGFYGSEGDVVFGVGVLVVALLLLGLGVLGGFFLGRWSGRRAVAREQWSGPPGWGAGAQPGWTTGPGPSTWPPAPSGAPGWPTGGPGPSWSNPPPAPSPRPDDPWTPT